jgi:hypothetical protein
MMIAIIKTIIFHFIYLVNGNWGTWQDWNSCSVTCGSGSRSRYHECNNPQPAHGGSNCQGNDTDIESCSMKLCPGKCKNTLTQGIHDVCVYCVLLN